MFHSYDYLLRSLLLCIFLTLALPGAGFSQAEGQAGREYLEFQRIGNAYRRQVLEIGYMIRVPQGEGQGREMEQAGRVDSFTDSTLVYRVLGSGDLAVVDLEATPYIRVWNKSKLVSGWALLSIAFATFLSVLVAFAVGSSVYGPISSGVLPLLLTQLIPSTLLFLGFGLLLLLLARRKLVLAKWQRRRVPRNRWKLHRSVVPGRSPEG